MTATSNNEQQFIVRLTEIVYANLTNEQFTVSDLAREAGLSHPSLHRRLKRISNQSVSQFIREVRLKKAMELLQSQAGTVAEVAYEVGFGSSTYFSKCFHNSFGYPPGKVARQINSDQLAGENQHHKGDPVSGKRRLVKSLIISACAVILAAILYFVFRPFANQQNNFENSIAVLPFRNDSPDSVNTYFINGLMEAIVTNLSNIEDLDVRSRTSSEEYRYKLKSIPEIAEELEVVYVVEASGQKYGDEIILNIQLIQAVTDHHLLSERYRREITSVKDLIDLQLEIAQDVVAKIEAKITPDEEAQIATLPTNNLAAYYLFLQGIAHLTTAGYYIKSYKGTQYYKERMKARQLFEEAVALDSTFSEAYAMLAKLYLDDVNLKGTTNKNVELDSGLVFIKKALRYDPENQNAKLLKYDYYLRKGMHKEAREMESVFSEMVKDHTYYEIRCRYYKRMIDYCNVILSFYRYQELKPSDQLTPTWMLVDVTHALQLTGFPDLANTMVCKRLKQDSDSIEYYRSLMITEMCKGDYPRALEYGLDAFHVDSTIIQSALFLMYVHLHLRDFSKAFSYVELLENLERESGIYGKYFSPLKGWAYLRNGKVKEADLQFQGAIRDNLLEIETNSPFAQNYYAYYYLAVIYSLMGNKEKAMEYLSILKHGETIDYGMITDLKFFPGFDIVRDDPNFEVLFNDLESRYLKLHNRVRKMLIKEGVLES